MLVYPSGCQCMEKNVQEYKYRRTIVIQNTLHYSTSIFLCFIVNKMVSDGMVPVEGFWSLSRRHFKYLQSVNVSFEPECSLSKEDNTHIHKIHIDVNKGFHFQSKCTEGHPLHYLEICVISQSSCVGEARLPHLLQKLWSEEQVCLGQL
jgi:hypothetical protein